MSLALRREKAARAWLLGFVGLQIACQLALLVPQLSAARPAFRVAAFGVSLVALAFARGASGRHPSRPWLLAALVLLGLQFFHPTTNSPLSGLAAVALNVAIAAPLIWVTRLNVTPRLLVQVLLLIWGFQTLSAIVGVLQALAPGEFMPQANPSFDGETGDGVKIVLADGATIFRPMGLTDTPGGAAAAGLTAYLLGLGFLTNARSPALRVSAVGGMAAGLFCMVLCQVRVAVVLAALMTVVFAVALAAARRSRDLLWVAALLPGVAAGSVAYALAVGGEATLARLETLVEDDPDAVYYESRGRFLEATFGEHLENYPLGAGLGRWGMVNVYFGDPANPDAKPLWVEIQWTAWLFDGGAPLMAAYAGAILAACLSTLRVARRCPEPRVAGWAAVLTAYNLGVCAVTFSYVPFIGQMGLEFWLLNAAVATAARAPEASP